MDRLLSGVIGCMALVVTALPLFGQISLTQQQKWEQKLQRYARQDSLNPPPNGIILFVGSSTIENWKTLTTDFPSLPILNRGISGTKTVDLYNFKNRVIDVYDPKQIFIYEGDNDIGLGWKTADIIKQYEKLTEDIRTSKPEAEIIYIAIKPSPRRLAKRRQVEEVNDKLRCFLSGVANATYVDMYNAMLDEKGDLIPEYYREDGLHLTPAGYAIWKKVIGEFLKN